MTRNEFTGLTVQRATALGPDRHPCRALVRSLVSIFPNKSSALGERADEGGLSGEATYGPIHIQFTICLPPQPFAAYLMS